MHIGGLLLNNVGHTDWPVEDGDPLSKDRDWGWDNGLTSALGRLSLELSLEGGWDARATLKAGSGARLVDEVGESSKVWPHNAHTWVLRSAERSPFMSPQRPTARDFSSCGATRTLREEPSGTILASVIPERILTIFFSPETVLVVMATGMCLEPSMRRTCSQSFPC